MNWTRYKLLIISGGISLIVCGGLIFWIVSTQSKNKKVSSQIQSLTSRQSQLFLEKPYPSEPNFAQLKTEQTKVIEHRDEMEKLIVAGELQPEQMRSSSSFGDYISGELVPELRKKAKESTKGGEYGVLLKDPDFGLTGYLSGILPELSKIPSLMLQIQTMEHFCLLLFDNGISELHLVKALVENPADSRRGSRPVSLSDLPGFNQNPMRGMDPMKPNADAVEDGRSEVQKQKERLFNWVDYRLEFKVYEDFFWEILNKIVSDPNQMVVTKLYVTNSNERLWPKYLEPVLEKTRQSRPTTPQRVRKESSNDLLQRLQEGDSAPEPEGKSDTDVQIAGLADRRQNVVGGDLLNVAMVVRVYRVAEKPVVTEEGF